MLYTNQIIKFSTIGGVILGAYNVYKNLERYFAPGLVRQVNA